MNRRQALAAAGTALSTGIVGCSGVLSDADERGSAGEDGPVESGNEAIETIDGAWPTHGYDVGNTRRTPATGVTGDVEERWTRKVGGVLPRDPVVRDGIVYDVAPGVASMFDGETRAIDAATGERVGDDALDGVEGSPLAVTDGAAYVTRGSGSDFELVALDAGTAAERWRSSIASFPAPDVPIVDGTAYVLTYYDSYVTAFDVADGTRRWRREADRSAQMPPSVGGGLVTFVAEDTVTALDAETGELRWQRALDGSFATPPVVADERVFAGDSTGSLAAFDRTGERRWSQSVGDAVWMLAADETALYAGLGDRVEKLDRATGERRSTPYDGAGDAGLTIADGTLYAAASTRETAAAVDLEDESTLWTESLEHPAAMGPTVVDGAVFVTTDASVDESGGTTLRAFGPA